MGLLVKIPEVVHVSTNSRTLGKRTVRSRRSVTIRLAVSLQTLENLGENQSNTGNNRYLGAVEAVQFVVGVNDMNMSW